MRDAWNWVTSAVMFSSTSAPSKKSRLMQYRKWSAGLRLAGTASPASEKKSMARSAAPK
jgi:hypothetical protein